MTRKKKTEVEEIVTAYKGFKQDLTCRGYQFEIGGTYKHEGEIEACASGFHSCEYPLDVFGYYAPGDSRFAIVKASGQLSRHDDDSKIASATLVVEAEISMPTMISRAIDWIMARLDNSVEQTVVGDTASNTGYQSAASNTGDYSAAEVSGKESVAASLGIEGRARASAGSAIVLCHRDDEGHLIHIRASKVGENGVKPDTWYQLSAEGEFVEFDE
ncbi:hypothetical protein [Pseudomonas aeruginosa]|uniref:DUF7666 domain-containing protein n=1 Tax=Pseudomonas aeruginosa TaxID=287 RepID=UPI001CD62D5B|nr:hypothetical protein [Pseudomonas aeruginosa]